MKKIFSVVMMAGLLMASSSQAKKEGTKAKAMKRATASAGQSSFYCLNQPVKKWGTYYAVGGLYVNSGEILEVQYGTFEGSQEAEEQEPVDTYEFKSIKHDPKLAASSMQWKTASAFDVSTAGLGAATLYIRQESFAGQEKEPVVRLKFAKGNDVKLPCTVFGK